MTSPLRLASSLCRLALLMLLPVSFCATGLAQISGRGTIQGSVSDPTGAVIPNAQVVVVQVQTNLEHSQKTTGAGFYVFGGLEPGQYSVMVTATGFQPYTQKNISLDALQVFGVNVKMVVAAAVKR